MSVKSYSVLTLLNAGKSVALKSYPTSNRVVDFILFDDGETYIELEEQDPIYYHDCNRSAKELVVNRSVDEWNRIMTFPDALDFE